MSHKLWLSSGEDNLTRIIVWLMYNKKPLQKMKGLTGLNDSVIIKLLSCIVYVYCLNNYPAGIIPGSHSPASGRLPMSY